MNVQLKELFDIIGERKTIDYSITADKLSEYGGYSFASPVAVTGEIVFKATETIMWSARTILLIWTN